MKSTFRGDILVWFKILFPNLVTLSLTAPSMLNYLSQIFQKDSVPHEKDFNMIELWDNRAI